MSIAVAIAACGKRFGATQALQPTTLSIAPGEIIAFLGPSGCGKTTLLRIVAGLETPDAGGRVRFGDADVTDVPTERRGVGMVFQSYALFPNMTVAQNIGYGLRVQGASRPDAADRVVEMLELVRIAELADRRVETLSGGQRQRVALARALAPRPRVLLLDEPLTALDAQLRAHLRFELDRLLRTLRITTIYVTHDQAEAMALADRVAVFSRGRVEQVGTPREVYHAPANAFVAGFVGQTSLLPDGTLLRPEDISVVAPEAGRVRGFVVSAQFLGERQRVAVEVDASTLFADAPARQSFLPGQVVGLAWDQAAPMRVASLQGGDVKSGSGSPT
jgi:putative spermidine/putrescine transport system ATP-binding protein